MRTADVRRTALLTALWLLAAAVGSAWLAGRIGRLPEEAREPLAPGLPARADPPSGRELYERHCRRCHPPEDLVPALRGPAPGLALLELLDFLEDHGASDAREDRAIAAYLCESAR